MKLISVVNQSRDRMVGARIGIADTWWLRLRGLLGRPALAQSEGLLLDPCASIHTLGMTYPIDVAFLDAAGRVVACYPGLRKHRITRLHREASCALELPSGTLAETGTATGDLLDIRR